MLRLLFLLLLVPLSAFSQDDDIVAVRIPPYVPAPAAERVKFANAEFSAEFAGKPFENDIPADTATVRSYGILRRGERQNVIHLKLNVSEVDDKLAVENVLKNYTRESRLKYEREVTVSGRKGREFSVENDRRYEFVRVVAFESEVFLVSASLDNWSFYRKEPKTVESFESEARRFMDSFSIARKPFEPGSPDDFLGAAENGEYVNRYFGFRFRIPEGWVEIDQEGLELGRRRGVEMLRTDREAENKRLEELSKSEFNIVAFGNRSGATVGGSNVLVSVRKQAKGVTASAVMDATRKLIGSNPAVRFSSPRRGSRDGVAFVTSEVETNAGGMTVTQQLIIAMRREHSVTIVVSYRGDQNFVDALTSSIRFF